MREIICYISPAILITVIYFLKYYLIEEKINAFKLIGYYLISSIIINFIMIELIYMKYALWVWAWDHDISWAFVIKYFLLGSFIGLFLPKLYYWIGRCGHFFKEYKIIRIKFNCKEFNRLKREIKKRKDKIIFIFTLFLLFFSMDIFVRAYSTSVSKFSSLYLFTPNIVTLTFCFLFTALLLYLPKLVSKILAWFLYLFNFGLLLTHYFLLTIKSEAFSIYDINNVSEGMEFLNCIVEKITPLLIIFSIYCILLMIVNYKFLLNVRKENSKFNRINLIRVPFICFIGFMLGNIALHDYNSNDWVSITMERYYYNNYVNPKKSISVLGLYEYTLRDIHLYFKNLTSTFGSTEEIETLISKYHVDVEKNEYTGMFKDKNLIMVMLESIDYVGVNEEVMPTLSYMTKNGWNFPSRYSYRATGGSTILTEYISMTGLLFEPTYYDNLNNNSYPYSLPNMFNKAGYITASVHENSGTFYNREHLHKSFGFDNSYFLYDILEKPNLYDDSQIVLNDEIYEKIVSKDHKFMSYIITIVGHGPYDKNNWVCDGALKYDRDCLEYLYNKTDYFLKSLLERLEEDDLLEDTVIVLYTDHQAYTFNYTEEDFKLYRQVDEDYNIKNIPFVIYNNKLKGKNYEDILVNDYDLIPTLLNLFGIDYDSDSYLGSDLFGKKHKNLIVFNDYRWYDGEIYSEGKDVDKESELFKENSQYAIDKITLNKMIISNDYFKNKK